MLRALEEKQTLLYAIVILIAIFIGLKMPDSLEILPSLIPFALGILMFSMFAQVPFLELKAAIARPQFLRALFISNYILVPLIVGLLLFLFSPETSLKIGILLVLLTPCIDYVVVFTKLGEGDSGLMLAVTPLLFFTQILLLPLYLWLFMGREILNIIHLTPLLTTFLTLILIPFFAAMSLQLAAPKKRIYHKILQCSAWLPVPFMALVLFLIVATQISVVSQNIHQMAMIIPLYIAFLIAALITAWLVGKCLKLPPIEIRTLIYSTGTRNSLAVLPFAFALPAQIAPIVAAVIVTQTLVELIGELFYTKITPHI